jgi:hypothetical protein
MVDGRLLNNFIPALYTQYTPVFSEVSTGGHVFILCMSEFV